MMFSINFINKTPLHEAIEKGNIEIVELLLKMPKIDFNFQLVLIQNDLCRFLNQKIIFYHIPKNFFSNKISKKQYFVNDIYKLFNFNGIQYFIIFNDIHTTFSLFNLN